MVRFDSNSKVELSKCAKTCFVRNFEQIQLFSEFHVFDIPAQLSSKTLWHQESTPKMEVDCKVVPSMKYTQKE